MKMVCPLLDDRDTPEPLDDRATPRGRHPQIGLKVRYEIDASYPKRVKVEDDEMAALNIYRHEFHGE
jgi:hypothetical protein